MRSALGVWDRFWFEPISSASLAVLRIAFGLLVLAWALTLLPNLAEFYSPSGIVSGREEYALVFVLLVTAAGAVVVGYRTRLATALVFGALLWFWWVNPYVMNAGDALIRYLALYLVLAPAGAGLSLDARRRGLQLADFPPIRAWPLRLIQAQLSAIYLAAAISKFAGETWRDGTAVHFPLHVPDLVRFPLPDALVETAAGIHLLTWGTIALELAIALGVWSRRARPWVLGAGVAFHLGLDYAMHLALFSWAVLVAYLAFLEPDWTERRLRGLTARRSRIRRAQPPASPISANGRSYIQR